MVLIKSYVNYCSLGGWENVFRGLLQLRIYISMRNIYHVCFFRGCKSNDSAAQRGFLLCSCPICAPCTWAHRCPLVFPGCAVTFPVLSPLLFSYTDAFCQTLVDTLESTPGLRNIWSTFKPLLQGKVLYTPDTPAARLLVNKVSSARGKMHDINKPGICVWKKSVCLIKRRACGHIWVLSLHCQREWGLQGGGVSNARCHSALLPGGRKEE